MNDLTTTATLYRLTAPQNLYSLNDQTISRAPGGQSRSQRLAEAAGKWVGQTFFSMLLQEMRRTVPKGGMFSGGRAEDIFNEMSDRHLAEALAERTDIPITKALIRQLGGTTNDK